MAAKRTRTLTPVVQWKKTYEFSESSKHITMTMVWVCILDCGHTQRTRGSKPDRMKCKACLGTVEVGRG